MANILVGDRVVLIQSIDKLNVIGETFEVANITETSIVLRNARTKIAVASIAIDSFDEYFVKEQNREWSPWAQLLETHGNITAFYRTNGRKVQVRIQNFRGEASCNFKTGDKFNLFFGIQLAYFRCKIKLQNDMCKRYQKAEKELESDTRECVHAISHLLKKLDSGSGGN